MAVIMGLPVWAALVGLATLLSYVWFRIAFRERMALSAKLPGPTAYPLIGNLYMIKESTVELFKYAVNAAGTFNEIGLAKIEWMHRVAVAVFNPADVEIILGSSVHLEKAKEYRFFKPWLGEGLLISSGDTWRTHRKLIAPTFHLNVLKQFVYLFNRNSRALCRKLDAVVGQVVDIHDYMSETTVEILLETAMGVDRSTQNRGYDYAMAVMKMCEILHVRMFRPWLWPDWLFNMVPMGREQKSLLHTIHSLTREVLKKRKAERKQGVREGLYKRVVTDKDDVADGDAEESTSETSVSSYGYTTGLRDDLDDDVGEKKRIAFLDQMLDVAENGAVLSDREVEEQVNTIMFEGHDTTAAGSSFFLSLMGVHQDIQERCVDELRTIFGDSQRPATFQDTLEMKYLERCINETLRLFPPVPVIARHATENIQMKSGHVIPEGTTIVIPQYLIHRDPTQYPNPEVFDPDNFLPERCSERHFYSFVPFSAGPRSCVGRKYAMLKLKILLSTVLRKFHVRADVLEKDFQLTGDIILKRKEGFPVRLYPRSTHQAAGQSGDR
ncbi:Cytochrome P450 CYP4g [Frankliniella occidentalis]|uniref:Cytochrome P450 4g15-like n=1 Tax=Frankliniella occidentalis TaxID=133901 RepID=A0A6J1SP41_FRAOC|nr:cytochrome P450 4g15-like [Frankliniella occidentalis]KAE8737231.1 Cytochrome P450 CYP4g [Frankliniella occidentalis]